MAVAEPHGAVVVTEIDAAVDEAGAIEAKVEPTETDVAPLVLAPGSATQSDTPLPETPLVFHGTVQEHGTV
jgi:hypothetical protein